MTERDARIGTELEGTGRSERERNGSGSMTEQDVRSGTEPLGARQNGAGQTERGG